MRCLTLAIAQPSAHLNRDDFPVTCECPFMTRLLHPHEFGRSCSRNKAIGALLIVGAFAVLTGNVCGQSLTDIGAAATTPGTYDVFQLSTAGNKTAPDGLNYYTDNQTGHNSGEPGQMFTTGNESSGYLLTSLAIKTGGLGSYNGIDTLQPYTLHLYSIADSTATLLETYTSDNIIFADGDWLQWSGLMMPLAANTIYAWSFGKASSTTGWEAMAVATNSPYADGEIALISPTTGATTFGSSHGFDAVFDVGLVSATLPTIIQFVVSPTNTVFAGTSVAFTASVTGAAPLAFQWQFDSGGGWADIAEAQTNTLMFAVALTNTGYYQLVVSNSYGAITSAPISLTVNLDTNPPVVLRAFNVGATSVELDYSKILDAASATNLANYAFPNSLTIISASLLADGKTVLLDTAPLVYGSNYTLVINGVRDQAIPQNTIATDTLVHFTASPRQRILLDDGWRFQRGDPPDATSNVTYYPEIADLAKLQSAQLDGSGSETYQETNRVDIFATHAGEDVSFVPSNFNDSDWRQLNLPHDWAVELPFDPGADGSHGFKPLGGSGYGANNIGWYRRTFVLPAAHAGRGLWLEFDGVYRNCLVWLNGHILGRNVSGYSSFHFDATPYANPGGTNILVVRVDASRFEGWFYEGAGIYRHVWLTSEDPVHVAQWGTFVATTSLLGSNATVTIQTDVTNQSGVATVNGNLISTIYDADSNVVASTDSALNISAGQGRVVTQTVAFLANRWSLQTPYLYKLVTTVSNQNAIADIYQTPFGVRTVSVDSTNGVFINGEHVEIQGMCNHQDHAGVGVALPDRLQFYRIERLKQMGVNGYRTSHNPPTPELLDACDQLGMLVLDENRRIGTNAEPMSELSQLIRRDRNHPSVFMWSLANEENSLQGTTTGAAIMQVMQDMVHSLDPTRKCTAAMNGGWGSGFSTVLDVQGFNYGLGGMDSFHSVYPAQSCIGTETSSEVGTRGIYTNDTAAGYVTAYDNNPVPWGETAQAWWQFYHARPWSSGGFSWTGFDYRGEPTPYGWPCINSHFGTLDMCGFPKDNFYYYQANWTLKPVLHLVPHWNWSTPGQPINVWAFGNCQAVELFTNGVSLGRQSLDVLSHVEWNVPYAPGTLQAIGYNFGLPVITNTVVTAGAPAAIALIPDRDTILADGRDVSVVTVVVLDGQGNLVPTATNEITFSIDGGTILGVGNGDASSHESDKASLRSVFNGFAQVIVQSTPQPSAITLVAISPGLTSTNVTIVAAANLPPPAAPTDVRAMGGNARVTISWDIVAGAMTYNLLRAMNHGGPYTLIAGDLGGVNLGYVDASVTNGTTYYYVVAANGNGTSANSAEASATPFAVVASVTATATNGQIAVSWTGKPGESYNLKRSDASGGPYTPIAASLTASNYTDNDVATCQPYFYVVTITNVGGESINSPEASAQVPGSLPPQFASIDIGSVGLPGSASYCNGQFTVSGSGADIWDTADAFQFVHTYVAVSTNCDIRARVDSVQATHSNAKAAVMIRETLDPGSRHVLVDVQPSAGIEFLYRTSGGGLTYVASVAGQTAPNWIRLTRTNDNFSAFWSPDGVSWKQIGTTTNIPMAGTGANIGLAVCAHNDSVLNTSVIDNLTASFLTNEPPLVHWVSPTNNQTVYQVDAIILTVAASDSDGAVTNVSFFNGATLLGNTGAGYAGQFSLAWSNAATGNYQLTAVATDNSGDSNTIPGNISVSIVTPPTVVLQTDAGALASDWFGLSFQGLANQTYVLMTSTDLVYWTAIQTNSTTIDGPVQFTDLTATNTVQFYRIGQSY